MRRIALFLSVGAIVMLLASGAMAKQPKVEICHVPPDDPDAAKRINLPERAVDIHLAHGDCIIDDGIDCTVDSCEPGGCSSVPDDSLCEPDEICDGVDGCLVVCPCLDLLPEGWEPDIFTGSAFVGICPDGSEESDLSSRKKDSSTNVSLTVSEFVNLQCLGIDGYSCSVTGQDTLDITLEQYLACQAP